MRASLRLTTTRATPFRRGVLAATLGAAILLAGCATKPAPDDADAVAEYNEANDPLEPTNRVFYAINNGLDTVILRPLAIGYRYAVPRTIRDHTHNVLSNLGNPVQLANDMLEAKPRRAGDSFMRLIINSTIGVAGVFDVAADWGYPSHDSDAGITMALWGIPDGPYLFLPILGPSNPRDAVGFGADIAIDPVTWVRVPTGGPVVSYARTAVGAVDARERVLDTLDKVIAQALDPYATIRSLRRQYRQGQIDKAQQDDRKTIPAWFAQPKPAPAP